MSRNLRFNGIFGGGIAVLATVLGVSFPANAALDFTIYNTFSEWEAAVGAGNVSTEDFNDFSLDTTFDTSSVPEPLDVGDFTLEGTGPNPDFAQLIDVPLLVDNDLNVDGSPLVNGAIRQSPFYFFDATFDSPITAFGADFGDVSDTGTVQIQADSGSGLEVVGSIPTNANFFGFTANGSFDTVRFDSASGQDGFGMDNVVYSNASTPSASVPFEFSPTLGLLAVGGVWGVSRMRKRFTAKKITDELS